MFWIDVFQIYFMSLVYKKYFKNLYFPLQVFLSLYYIQSDFLYMIYLEQSLVPGTTYVNAGNIFSKSLLLQERSKKQKTLFVVNESKKIKHYFQIWDFLELDYIVLKDYASLVELLHAPNGLYIVDQDLFQAKIVNNYQFENKYTFCLETGTNFAFDKKVTELSDLGYVYSEHGKKWSYKKLWDLLHIYPPFSESYYFRVNFFDDEIENIEQVFIGTGKTQERSTLFLWKIEGFPLESSQKFTREEGLIHLLQKHEIQIIADSLDFYTYKEDLAKLFDDIIFFDVIKNKHNNPQNLWVHELYIDDLSALTQYLQDTSYVQRYVFTKNKSTLDNFLNYNNIKWVKVVDCRVKNIGSFYTDIPNAKNTLVVHIKEWDHITHIDHWVWVFQGIIKRELEINGRKISKEYLELHYLDQDKLFVPITEVKRVSKYIGSENPKLTNLGTKEWVKKLKKVNEEIEDIAEELLDIFAKRHMKKGFQFDHQARWIDSSMEM